MKRYFVPLLVTVVGLGVFMPPATATASSGSGCYDVTGDGLVRVDDVLAVAKHYAFTDADSLSRYDLTHNGLIRIDDVVAVLSQYYKTCPEPIDARAMSDVVVAAEAMETCATDNNGSYAACDELDLIAIEPTLWAVSSRLRVISTTTTYAVSVASDRDNGNVVFTLSRASVGMSARTCTVAGGVERGLCAEDGSWKAPSPSPGSGVGDAAAKAAVVTAAEAMETCATDNNGSYAICDLAAIQAIEPTLAHAPVVVVMSHTADTYVLQVTSTTGTIFTLARASSGTTTRTCTPAGSGGCSAGGTW